VEQTSLNILLITDGIPPYVTGGMQKYALILSKLMAQKKHNVTLIHCGYFNQIEFNENVDLLFTPNELKYLTIKHVPFLIKDKLPGNYIRANKRYSKDVYNRIKNELESFDLIYAQGFTGWSFMENPLKIPVFTNLHGLEMYQKAPSIKVKLQHFLLRPTTKIVVKKSDFIWSFGGKIDHIIKQIGIKDHKIITQTNGIQKEWVTDNPVKNQAIRTFTFIGRFERRKGIEELNKALNILLKESLNFKFNFVGPVPKHKQIQHPSINYSGMVKDQNQIKTILDASDFLINPSYAEGMPTVILEAMARGNAIIATDVGATSQLILNNGWLISTKPKNIAEAIKKGILLNNEDLIKMKQKSIELVKQNFLWENVVQQQLDDLIKAIQNYK
jgi:glycosyltransferase involved in cell wall biosynthesis